MNDVKLLGRLTRNPEVRYTQEGTAVARFDLAVNKPQANGEQGVDYFHIVAWGKQAEFTEKYLAKGRQIVVSGRLSNNKWTDKNGQNRVTTEVIVEKIFFADSKAPGTADQGNTQSTPADADGFMNIPDDVAGELPFN